MQGYAAFTNLNHAVWLPSSKGSAGFTKSHTSQVWLPFNYKLPQFRMCSTALELPLSLQGP